LKRISILTLFLLIVFTSLTGASAQRQPCAPCPPGSICTLPECPPEPLPPVRGGVFTNPAWLKVDHHRIDVEIENQIAVTSVDLEFVNEGNGLAEGTFLFPLPAEASVDQLVMYINGQPIDAKILPADEARQTL
jgi:Vault protein inter-alpha-trypsin.